jgi:hypothetical protein
MTSASRTQLFQFTLAALAVISVTVLCALGRLMPESALITILTTAGISGTSLTALHMVDTNNSSGDSAPKEPVPAVRYDPNATPSTQE